MLQSTCPDCGKRVASSDLVCPRCKHELAKPVMRALGKLGKSLLVVAGGGIVVLVIAVLIWHGVLGGMVQSGLIWWMIIGWAIGRGICWIVARWKREKRIRLYLLQAKADGANDAELARMELDIRA